MLGKYGQALLAEKSVKLLVMSFDLPPVNLLDGKADAKFESRYGCKEPVIESTPIPQPDALLANTEKRCQKEINVCCGNHCAAIGWLQHAANGGFSRITRLPLMELQRFANDAGAHDAHAAFSRILHHDQRVKFGLVGKVAGNGACLIPGCALPDVRVCPADTFLALFERQGVSGCAQFSAQGTLSRG